jgi:predicted DCC family thiol-disulfide oxidoreductase YuxK
MKMMTTNNGGKIGRQHIVLYDDQCDTCRGGARWVRWLDREGQVRFVGLEEGVRMALHPSLKPDECRRLMHVVTPDHQVWVGWDAVTGLARLFPLTWILGVVGAVRPFRWLGRHLYRWVARHRYMISRFVCRICGVESTAPKCRID